MRSVVSSNGKFTFAPILKTQTSNGAWVSASLRKEMTSSSLRASSERGKAELPAASISFTSGPSFSPLRRPTNKVKPSAANFLAISAPMKSPAPITATVWFLMITKSLLSRDSSSFVRKGVGECLADLCRLETQLLHAGDVQNPRKSRPPDDPGSSPQGCVALSIIWRTILEFGRAGSGNGFLHIGQPILAEEHVPADEEGRRPKHAARNRILRKFHEAILDVSLLRAREQMVEVDLRGDERVARDLRIIHFLR